MNRFKIGSRFSGPCKENEILDNEVMAVILPWKGFQAKRDFRRLEYCFAQAQEKNTGIICIADDPYRIEWAGPILQKYTVPKVLISNYLRDPTKCNPGWEGVTNVFWPHYPFDQIIQPKTRKPPRYRVGYVGRFIPERAKLLGSVLPDDGILIGPQWDRLPDVPSIHTEDGGLEWYDLAGAYQSCRWQLMVSDSRQNVICPAVSRVGESLVSGVPLLFHTSCVAARPDIDWSDAIEYMWTTKFDLEACLDVLDPIEALWDQTTHFLPQYYPEASLLEVRRLCM